MKVAVKILAVFLVLLVFGGFYALQPPVDETKLQLLQKGMNKAQVEGILGTPTKVYSSGDWQYSKPLVFGFVNLSWEKDDTYDGEYNYERF